MWQAKSANTPHQHHVRSSPIHKPLFVTRCGNSSANVLRNLDVRTRRPICQRKQDISVHSVPDLDKLESVNPYVILRLPVNQRTEMKVRTGYILSHHLNTLYF